MADEITYSDRLSVQKSGVESFDNAQQNTLIDLSGTDDNGGSQSVTTSEEALALGDVAAGGLLRITNLSSSGVLLIKGASGETPLVALNPGEKWTFRTYSGSTPYIEASTGTVIAGYRIWDA